MILQTKKNENDGINVLYNKAGIFLPLLWATNITVGKTTDKANGNRTDVKSIYFFLIKVVKSFDIIE